MSDLYREATDQEVRASMAGNRHDIQRMWAVPVERCEHGFFEEHDFFVAKVDASGLRFRAIEWCVGSPTLEDDDE